MTPIDVTQTTIPRLSGSDLEQLDWISADGLVNTSSLLPSLDATTRLQADYLIEDISRIPSDFTSASASLNAVDTGKDVPYPSFPTSTFFDPAFCDLEQALYVPDIIAQPRSRLPSTRPDNVKPDFGKEALDEVRQVDPHEYLSLLKTDGFRIVQNLLKSASSLVETGDVIPVSYNESTWTIKLCGPPIVTRQAKIELEHLLRGIRADYTTAFASTNSPVSGVIVDLQDEDNGWIPTNSLAPTGNLDHGLYYPPSEFSGTQT
ncbi:hypothetical protein MMC18_009304, partial [Xylographa bjoerkii]|nr:hypothetical protein [Xylographa bjoerkii]